MELKPNDIIQCTDAAEFCKVFRTLKKEGYNLRSVGNFRIKILEKERENYEGNGYYES